MGIIITLILAVFIAVVMYYRRKLYLRGEQYNELLQYRETIHAERLKSLQQLTHAQLEYCRKRSTHYMQLANEADKNAKNFAEYVIFRTNPNMYNDTEWDMFRSAVDGYLVDYKKGLELTPKTEGGSSWEK